MSPERLNAPAPGCSYFTPKQCIPAGTAVSPDRPVIFQPLKIRDVTFHNRIFVAPMCTFSADDGHLTDFHFQHLSVFAFRGAGLTTIEATSVSADGRISPEDSGLWKDSQIAPIKRIAEFVHSQGQKLAIQLAHAGRKASTLSPWAAGGTGNVIATEEQGGWPKDVVGPSTSSWGAGTCTPNEMSKADIEAVIADFGSAARRAVEAGVDVIEIHAAHGYLFHQFLSKTSNQRTDEYGGSWENRLRVPCGMIKAVRDAMPSGMPLFVRVSVTEWLEEIMPDSWVFEDTLRLVKMFPDLGVDLVDVSSAGNHEKQKIFTGNEYQVNLAGKLRGELAAANCPVYVGAVGRITDPVAARDIVGGNPEKDIPAKADVIFVGRQFLRDPAWVVTVGNKIGVKVQVPVQYQGAKSVSGS